MRKKTRIIFEIHDKKLRDALKSYAKKESRTLKYVVESAFKEYLENHA